MGLRVRGEENRIGGGCREWVLWLLYMMDTWGGVRLAPKVEL